MIVFTAQLIFLKKAWAYTQEEISRILFVSFSGQRYEKKDINAVDIEQYQYVSPLRYELNKGNLSSKIEEEKKAKKNNELQALAALVPVLYAFFSEATHPVRMNQEILIDTKAAGEKGEKQSTVLNRLFPAYTLAGQVFRLMVLAKWPTSDVSTIENRQERIQQILVMNPDYSSIEKQLSGLRQWEPKLADIYYQDSLFNSEVVQEELKSYMNQGFFQQLWSHPVGSGILSISTHFLTFSGYLALILSALRQPTYCSAQSLCSWGGVVVSISLNQWIWFLESRLEEYFAGQRRVSGQMLKEYISAVSAYLQQVVDWQLSDGLPEALKIHFTTKEFEEITGFLEATESLAGAVVKGRNAEAVILHATELIRIKDVLAKVIFKVGEMDLFLAIAARMHASEAVENANEVTIARFRSEPEPCLSMVGFWNPLLDNSTAVSNTLQLGCAGSDLKDNEELEYKTEPVTGVGLLLSGNNASGKSTLMRAVTLNSIFLAQTLGVAAAKSYEASIFHEAGSYMDKFDKAGESSSYMEELRYVSELLKKPGIINNENKLVCFDELFSTTDPDDGRKGFEIVLKALGRQSHLMALISTHYDLADTGEWQESFNIMHMGMTNSSGYIRPTYQIEEGPNKCKVALEFLAETFQSELPDIAEKIRTYRAH